MDMGKFSKSSAALLPSVLENQTIPFVFKVKKMNKDNRPDAGKMTLINL
jgi:hypothetical protein